MDKIYALGILAAAPLALQGLASLFGYDFMVDELPAWWEGLTSLFMPAWFALLQLPILGTLMWCLGWIVTFEFAMWAVTRLLRFAEWSGLTGRPFITEN